MLEENTRLQLKMERVCGSVHSDKEKGVRNNGINYRTVSSYGGDEYGSVLTDRSKVLNRYCMARESGNFPLQENYTSS